jgi:hypothetical protein
VNFSGYHDVFGPNTGGPNIADQTLGARLAGRGVRKGVAFHDAQDTRSNADARASAGKTGPIT